MQGTAPTQPSGLSSKSASALYAPVYSSYAPCSSITVQTLVINPDRSNHHPFNPVKLPLGRFSPILVPAASSLAVSAVSLQPRARLPMMDLTLVLQEVASPGRPSPLMYPITTMIMLRLNNIVVRGRRIFLDDCLRRKTSPFDG